MGKPRVVVLISFFLAFLHSSFSFSQIIFKELPGYQIQESDELFDLTETRNIISLNGTWNVYSSEDKEKKRLKIAVPSLFEGEGELVFEKSFNISTDQLAANKIRICFLGLNYTADISVNDIIIYRHSGGEFPFNLNLPKDIVNIGQRNILSIKLFYRMDSQNTIPVKQRFLFPKSYGGIFRDVYLQLYPNISISDAELSYKFDPKTNKVKFNLNSRIENQEFKSRDTLLSENQFSLKVLFIPPSGTASNSTPEQIFQLTRNKEKTINQSFEFAAPVMWSPSNPQSYTVSFELRRSGSLVDRVNRKAAVYSFVPAKDSVLFNGTIFKVEGIEYVPSNYEYGQMLSYDQMERDVRLIKEAGFNTVKFSKTVPHPYYFVLCERMGLLAFTELPVSSVPSSLTSDVNFIQRSKNYLNNFLKAYKKFTVIAGIGFGNSFLPDVQEHRNLIENLATVSKKELNAVTYASFSGFEISEIPNLDMYGIELINTLPSVYTNELESLKESIGKGRLFISTASYVVNSGNSDGYVNKFTYEAQAKYFEDLIDYTSANYISGYFISSMFDYRGEYASLLGGYTDENLYNVGIAGENRSTERIAYKVISAKLHNAEKVTIPIGTRMDDAPMIFIICGILFAIILGILVNSGRKFREDSSRALLRPYNFFADVRDQRLISGIQSSVLAILISAVSGLLLSNLLFYFKEDLLFERVLLAFGSHWLIKTISYLSWHPFNAILLLSVFSFVILGVMTLIIKAGSFFVRNRVYLSSVYFAVTWSFLPIVLFIPVGIVLYRILVADVANVYIYIALIFLSVWIFYRLMKGIYVIFDVNAGSIYFYSILFIIVVAGGILMYYEMQNSVFEYLQLAFSQNNVIR